MTMNEYQTKAMRTSNDLSLFDHVRCGCYGMNGEAGECIDTLKKVEFQGHAYNPDKLIEEVGDVLWYIAEAATGLGVTLEELARRNIEKLEARYPEGFDPERSMHRKPEPMP